MTSLNRCILSALLLLSFADTVSAETTLFRNTRVFDGIAVHQDVSVLIVDGVIRQIGNVAAPTDANIIECQGKTLIPGLIDAHVHVTQANVQRDALRFGITTQLDMFTSTALLPQFKRSRGASSDLADTYSAGTMITAPGGHGTQSGLKIPTLEPGMDAAAFIAARIAEGSDYIKLTVEDGLFLAGGQPFPSLDQNLLRAAIAAAHAHNKIAIVHVSGEEGAIRAVEAGADGLAHVFSDRVATDAFIALAKRNRIFVIATLSMVASATGGNASKLLLDDQELKPYLSSSQTATLQRSLSESGKRRAVYSIAAESVRRLHAAGIPILAGTDAFNPGVAHGVSMHGELALLVAAGLTPIEALRAATSLPAKYFGLEDRGSIAVGRRADLVLIDGDPTLRIEDTRRIAGIWKNGRALTRLPTVTSDP